MAPGETSMPRLPSALILLSALAFLAPAGHTRGEKPFVLQAIDAASRSEVRPAVIASPGAAARAERPGPDATLLREVAQAAREIKARLAGLPEGKRTVTIGAFTCPTNTNATGGALLRHLLALE